MVERETDVSPGRATIWGISPRLGLWTTLCIVQSRSFSCSVLAHWLRKRGLRNLERLIDVPEDVVHVLNANREANVIVGCSGCDLLFGAELRVGGRRRMNCQRACITNVGKMREKLK